MHSPSDWNLSNGKLTRTFEFATYGAVIEFVNRVAAIAEALDHHPDMLVCYGKVECSIMDHAAGRVSEKCIAFCERVNQLSSN